MQTPSVLILENGIIFKGISIGALGKTCGEIVFNTSMTGYQEVLTDPSYKNQIVTFTFPHIGNTGINIEDEESDNIQVKGIIIRKLSLIASNYRSKSNLSEYLKKNNIIGISEIDTRKLTRILRDEGTQYGYIYSNNKIYHIIKNHKTEKKPNTKTIDLVKKVSTKNIYTWNKGKKSIYYEKQSIHKKKEKLFHIIVYDFGVKKNILRMLVERGCYITVVPSTTQIKEILKFSPDGILLSNGPGDPRLYSNIILSIQELLKTNIPIFGICLGHQLLALAYGAKIIKMKFGHHGCNHPVKHKKSNKVMITSQNHNFSIDITTLPKKIKITHISLFDQTIQGIRIYKKNAFGFQGHPEASPGPNEAESLFNKFINSIKKQKQNLIK
ncbi:glutamine-hydrolyzing carbamoyl-phosphate synthase small subunit [Buchnera aphidicola]